MPLLRSDCDQGVASGGRYAAQLQIHCGGGAAAESAHVKGNELRVAHDEANGVERHAKLFGDSLGKGSANILADFHFAGENGDVSLSPMCNQASISLGRESSEFLRAAPDS